jgi:hypothetical protein
MSTKTSTKLIKTIRNTKGDFTPDHAPFPSPAIRPLLSINKTALFTLH